MAETESSVVLKAGKEKSLRNRHRWIFSGAVQSYPEMSDGEILPVTSASGELLAHAYFNRRASIVGRAVSFGNQNPLETIANNVRSAVDWRRRWLKMESQATNAYRVINAEADGLPGLVADLYRNVLVLQITTLGMERLRDQIVPLLNELLRPDCIVEMSDQPSRKEEGLPPANGLLAGTAVTSTDINEGGLTLRVDFQTAQKTGLFLDQRSMRLLAQSWASGLSVLDCFSNTGAFALHALKGGAASAVLVDSSNAALEAAKANAALNGSAGKIECIPADAFDYLRKEERTFDLVIVDPPAFAKKKSDVIPACRGYKDINRLAFKRTSPGGLLATFSCSHFVDRKLFEQVIFQAAQEANRGAQIVQYHRTAPDHPVSVFHPEGQYLKGMVIRVT